MAELVQLKGLHNREYSHPFDEEARSTLESVPGTFTSQSNFVALTKL